MDPTLVAGLATALSLFGAYRARVAAVAAQVERAREILGDGLEHVIDRLLVAGVGKAARWTVAHFETEGWALLERARIVAVAKRPAFVRLAVHELAVWAHAETYRRLTALASKLMPAQLDELANEAAAVLAAFRVGPLVPHDGPGVEPFEIVEIKAP